MATNKSAPLYQQIYDDIKGAIKRVGEQISKTFNPNRPSESKVN